MAGVWLSLAGAAVDAVGAGLSFGGGCGGAGLTAAGWRASGAGRSLDGEVVADCHPLEGKNTERIKYFLGNLQNVTMWHGFRGRIGTVRNLRERPAGYPARAFGVYAASFGGRNDGAEIGREG